MMTVPECSCGHSKFIMGNWVSILPLSGKQRNHKYVLDLKHCPNCGEELKPQEEQTNADA